MRLIGPLRRPLWLAATVGEGVLKVALEMVREVRGALEEVIVAEPAPARSPRSRRESAPSEGSGDGDGPSRGPRRSAATSASQAPEPPAAAPDVVRSPRRHTEPPPSAPDVAAPTPAVAPVPIPDEAKVLDDEPELVGEFGEEGAEENVGADVSVDEPWEGYGRMNVAAVREHLAAADRELLATVVLYEGVTKRRGSVIAAAERRLKQLSPPRS